MHYPRSKSWFLQIRALCQQYGLSDPLFLLKNPSSKSHFKEQCRLKVLEYWHKKLSSDVVALPSLRYFNPACLSLLRPHHIWTSLDGNPCQTKAAIIQALFLSGRYRTEKMRRFWSQNKLGYCLLEPRSNLKMVENCAHILLRCTALEEKRRRLYRMSSLLTADLPLLSAIIDAYLFSEYFPQRA